MRARAAFPQKTAFSGIVNLKREIISAAEGDKWRVLVRIFLSSTLIFNTLIHTISPAFLLRNGTF
jgi:glycerol-3-phosphate responsive antiterminator